MQQWVDRNMDRTWLHGGDHAQYIIKDWIKDPNFPELAVVQLDSYMGKEFCG